MAGLLGCLLCGAACLEKDPHGREVPTPAPEDDTQTSDPVPLPEFVSSPAPMSSGYVVNIGPTSSSLAVPPGNYVDGGEPPGPERALAEADIVQVAGDRVYALSRYSGLTIIDASDPAALKTLGVYSSSAIPVEMYVQDGLVYALFNFWYDDACDDAGACSWHITGRVQALDTRDAAHIQVLTDVELPGTIDASRRLGDVLVVVADHVDGCWGCGDSYGTIVSSFNVTEQSPLAQLDQLSVPDLGYIDGDYITVSDSRIYFAESHFDDSSNWLPSTLHVVDFSDPSGALTLGASFDVGGPVRDRGQLDESEGVLRVFSQPRGLGSGEPPTIETFRITSSTDFQRAGSVTIPLHETYEVLDRVAFDGPRAYVGTNKQRHPISTVDLSDPAAPHMAAQLSLPGRLYHLEPLADRLLVLGASASPSEGSLNVSLFDVQDLAAPTLLGSVPFGGNVSHFDAAPERDARPDLDSVAIEPDLGLILVPFAGAQSGLESCESAYGSGIQLLDLGDTTLTRRGVAPQAGSVRRAFVYEGQLFGVGGGSVQTFDITDRDTPRPLSQLAVNHDVIGIHAIGNDVLRLGGDWLSRQSTLDLNPSARAAEAQPTVTLDLSALLPLDEAACGGTWTWSGEVFVRGNYAYLPRYMQAIDPATQVREQRLTLYVVDIGDPSAPRAVGRLALPSATDREYFTGVVQTDNTLLVGRIRFESPYYASDPTASAAAPGPITAKAQRSAAGAGTGEPSAGAPASGGVSPDVPHYLYDVIELSNPAVPTIASRVDVPLWISSNNWGWPGADRITIDRGWGWYDGRGSGLLAAGDLLIGSHGELVGDTGLQEAYYLDRIDVSDPYQPTWLPPINIPGALLDYDAETNQLITLGFISETEPGDSDECSSRGYTGYFESETQACRIMRRSISSVTLDGDRAVRTSEVVLDRTQRAMNIAVSADRVFITTADFPALSPAGTPLSPPPGAVPTGKLMLETLHRADGQLTPQPSVELLPSDDDAYENRLYARGERAFQLAHARMTVVDTLDPNAVTQLTHGLPDMTCTSLEVTDDAAYCATGAHGVEVIDLTATR